MAKLDEQVVSPEEWDTQDQAFADLDRINKEYRIPNAKYQLSKF